MAKILVLVLTYQVACAVIGYRLGEERDRAWLGVAIGCVFGVLGLLVLALSSRPSRPA